METSRSTLCFFVLCMSLLIPTSSHNHLPSLSNHVALFIFGDSFFDAGNNNYINNASQANFWPYGETFFKYPTGRFSDGRIIPDFLAEYAKIPLIEPYLQPSNHQYTAGVNFASGGAGALVETHRGMVIDLKRQLSYFKIVKKQLRRKLGDGEAKKLLSKAIYLFSIGSNDYTTIFTKNTSDLQSYSRKEYVGMVISNLTTVIKEIYKHGGRKFGFLNVPPWASTPSLKAFQQGSTEWYFDEINVLVNLHNKALPEVLKEQQSELREFKYSVFDLYTSLSERINSPSKFGFKEGKVACCGSGRYRGIISCGGKGEVKEYQLCDNPSEYLFFDGAHPTEKANNQFAKLMWSGSPDVTGPHNLKTLVQA